MKRIFAGLFAILAGLAFLAPAPVFADENKDNCVETAILGTGNEVCDNNGDSVIHILKLVVDIMTIGIGILGVIGISITGIQYLTAGGSEEKTRKAKRRMFEIVIGLVAYVLIYAILSWLLPSFSGS